MVDHPRETPEKPKDGIVRVKRFDFMTVVTGLLPDRRETTPVDINGSGDGSPVTSTNKGRFGKKKSNIKATDLPPKPRTKTIAPPPAPPTVKPLRNPPQAVVVGAQCSGAQMLSKLISLHPQVKIINNTYSNLILNSNKVSIPLTRHGQILVDISPNLLTEPISPPRLRILAPRVKLIVMLRDPLDRCIACYHKINKHLEGSAVKSFEDYVLNTKGKISDTSQLVKESLYDIYLTKWLRYFNISHWLFIDYYQLISQPFLTLGRVEKFLGIQSYFRKNYFIYNKQQILCLNSKYVSRAKLKSTFCFPSNTSATDLSLGSDLEEQLKDYFVPHMEQTLSLVSSHIVLGDLTSLMN